MVQALQYIACYDVESITVFSNTCLLIDYYTKIQMETVHRTFGELEVDISKLYCISINEHYIYFNKTRRPWCMYVFCGSILS